MKLCRDCEEVYIEGDKVNNDKNLYFEQYGINTVEVNTNCHN